MAKKNSSPKRRAVRTAKVGGIYTFRVPDGQFGACQVLPTRATGEVVEMSKNQVEIGVLDYLSSKPPSAEGAATLRVLRRTWGSWDGKPDRTNVDQRVPWWVELVTHAEPVETFKDECLSFGGWYCAFGAYHGDQWERRGHPARKVDHATVWLDLGTGSEEIRLDATQISIGPGGTFQTNGNRLNFNALDALPHLTEIRYVGQDPAFADYIIQRKIPNVAWHAHGQQTIDLRASHVGLLSLDVDSEPVTLKAPQTLWALTISGNSAQLTVEGARLDSPFRLHVCGPQITQPPRGVEAVQVVTYSGLLDTDTSGLASYTRLTDLRLQGGPGKLRDASALNRLTGLRELDIYEMYDLDGAGWPLNWPLLEGVRIHGVRKADARSIKVALATVPDVRISATRGDAWIAAHLSNPFRGWRESQLLFGQAACAAWKKAKSRAKKLGPNAEVKKAKQMLESLVVALNRLCVEHAYEMDTIQREEAGDAVGALALEAGVTEEQASLWFDEWRDF